ncbi:MAG: type II secretion system F family protein [Pedosphaera sp.]|nr:type II secretion system F family protein [Pedosphaera sp.]
MAQFTYKARKKSGEAVNGSVEASDRSAAALQIERIGLMPVSISAPRGVIKPARSAAVAVSSEAKSGEKLGFRALFTRGPCRPKLQELAMYTHQLANLLKAGMPLIMALRSMESLSTRGIPSEVSRQLKQDVTEGRSLSDSMARQSHVFPDLVINMVRAGEQSGALEEVLRRQSVHFERFAEVQSKFKAAMIYPAVVCVVGGALVIFFMTVMLPKFMTLFDNTRIELPALTRMLISISNFLSGYWWALLLASVASVVLFRRYRATPSGRAGLDRLVMKLPVVGSVFRLNLFGQFARTLSTLLQNGVPVLQALRITEQVIPNVVLKEAISRTREAVTDGKTLAQPLAKSRLFPQLMIDLIKIGEETGDVPSSLANLADMYENDLKVALGAMTNLIQPVIIVAIAFVVGFMLLGVMSAMFKITESIATR